MELGARLGALAADASTRAERTLHRLAQPAAIALAPVLLRQAKQLQRNLVWLPEPGGARRGVMPAPDEGAAVDAAPTGSSHAGAAAVAVPAAPAEAAPLRLLAIGDSTATGVGTERLADGLVVQTASRLSQREGRPVAWRIVGLEGSTAAQVLERFLPEVDDGPWDAILLLVGSNDALQLVGRGAFSRSVRALVDGLAAHLAPDGVIVLSGTPQIDTFVWLPQPIRSLIGGHARALDDALQRIAAADARVLHVPTPAIVEPEQHAADGFHPSAEGYRVWSSVVAPRLGRALAQRRAETPQQHGVLR